MSWDEIGASTGTKTQDEKKMEFVKLLEGITKLRILGLPKGRWTHFITAQKRSANCPGRGCPICAIINKQKKEGVKPTYNSTQRYTVLALNRETERVEYLDQGKTFFEDLRDFRKDNLEEHGEMDTYDIKVKRSGTRQDDTRYRIDFAKATPLTDDEKEMWAKAIPVDEYFKPHTPEQLTRIINGESFEEVMKTSSDVQEQAPASNDPDPDLVELE